MKRILAIAVTLAMMLAALTGCKPASSPSGFAETQAPSAQTQPSPSPGTEPATQPSEPSVSAGSAKVKINSLDKLNYYAAVRMVTDTPTVSKQSKVGGSYKIVMLTGTEASAAPDATEPSAAAPEIAEPYVTTPGITEPAATDGPPLATDSPDPTEPESNIAYYRLDPDQPFHIGRVNLFQIELTDENGYLASKLGLGLVDVVVTESCIWGDSLITFRCGDRFFSCLQNGWHLNGKAGGQEWNFSSHKYVEGFNIVKNFSQENCSFYVYADTAGQIVAFECFGDRADQNVTVVGDTRISDRETEITAAELEAYFNKTEDSPLT